MQNFPNSANLQVKLLTFTPNPLAVIYAAFRQCYSSESMTELWDSLKETSEKEKQEKFLSRVLASGHASPLEHVSFTFAVSGISRACSHQLVRHRLASYSQQSQRYVNAENFQYIVPPEIAAAAPEKQALFLHAMEIAASAYHALRVQGVKEEDARFVLPNAAATSIVLTMNSRELLHFFSLRCCNRAQWEIHALADEMLKQCRPILPAIFENAGAKCEKLKYCPEGKFSCGKYPTKD